MAKQPKDPYKGRFGGPSIAPEDLLRGIRIPDSDYDTANDPNKSFVYNPIDADYVDYKPSSYDPGQVFVDNLDNLEQIRAENQGFLSTLGNAIGRAAVNIIPTVIGNTASILDFEDYNNQDAEVGNSITRAMEEFKQSVNQDYLPIYRQNPGESFDIGDSAWWLENGSALVESIGAFAITGAGLGMAFNAIGKGLSMINGLSKLGQAGKAAATVLSATGLNQAESITTAMQVYDTTYQQAMANGKTHEQAQEDAADAASYSININRANIALNLTSAGAFIRSPKLTRQIREAFGANSGREMLGEGMQEYAEETINYLSQKEGERYGEARATGKKYEYDIQNSIKDAFSAEGIESGVLGFIGGAGQTALTRTYNRLTGQAQAQDEAFVKQQESLTRIAELQDAKVVPDISNVFKNVIENVTLQKQIEDAVANGDDVKAKELQYQLLDNQIVDALENGTVQQLEDVYTNILNLSEEEASARGLDTEVDSKYNYKKKAQDAINLINDVEDTYLTLANKGYMNFSEVLNLDIKNKSLNRLLTEVNGDFIKAQNTLLSDKLNFGIEGAIDAENPSEALMELPSYEEYAGLKTVVGDIRKTILENNAKMKEITSKAYQQELVRKEQEAIQKELDKADKAEKVEEEKQVKKNQKESKKKVDAAKVKKNKVAEEEKEVVEEDEVSETPPDNIVPAPTIEDIPPIQGEETGDEGLPAEFLFSEEEEVVPPANPVTSDEVTQEDIVVAKIIEQDETSKQTSDLKKDGLVKISVDLEKSQEPLKYIDETLKRSVGNTVISLNIPYIELVLGEVGSQVNVRTIEDTYDEEGNILINDNFDSRLQSPNQFGEGTKLNITIPSYQELNTDNYTTKQYDEDINNVDRFPIAFTDESGKIVGFLPTIDNVKKRVDSNYLEAELIKNKAFREAIFNNKDSEISIEITRKSVGALITNKSSVRKSIYEALGNGRQLADGVSIGIQKESSLQIGTGNSYKKVIINKKDLEEGVVYTILPTAKKDQYIAVPADVSKLGENNARTVLKMIQLFKAHAKDNRDKELVAEREQFANEVDFSNIVQLNNAINTILYTSTDNDAYTLKLGDSKLSLGTTKDLNFKWDDVKYNPEVQEKIISILSNRYHSVQLTKFGNKFNHYVLDNNGAITTQRYNSYFDYLNNNRVVTTNVQGFPVENTNNEYYFTAQSVIEISEPIVSKTVKEVIPQATEVITYTTDFGEISYKRDANGDLQMISETKEKSIPVKKANKMGIKYKPNKGKNTPKIDEDISELNYITHLSSLDAQAQELMKKCSK